MTQGLADTSLFIARETGRTIDFAAVPDELAVSVITIGELRAGVLVASDTEARSRRLATLTQVLTMDPVPVDGHVAASWAVLRVLLRDRGQRLPVNDSWIAATAMALEVPVVTQDDDYPELPGLDIIRV
ncbi:MAG: Ribonuclease VapC5 [Acidimicrobiales bacterium]|nr:Ribonuclease VapC5 [Acidimicrobiales bacterium]